MEKIEFLIHFILNMPASVILFCGLIINGLLLFPVIFNYYIIPKIEKRIKQKIVFDSLNYRFLKKNFIFGKFLASYAEISLFILLKYLIAKFEGYFRFVSIKYFMWKFRKCSLQEINYNIESASKFEIFMSLLVILCAPLMILCGILIYYGY